MVRGVCQKNWDECVPDCCLPIFNVSAENCKKIKKVGLCILFGVAVGAVAFVIPFCAFAIPLTTSLAIGLAAGGAAACVAGGISFKCFRKAKPVRKLTGEGEGISMAPEKTTGAIEEEARKKLEQANKALADYQNTYRTPNVRQKRKIKELEIAVTRAQDDLDNVEDPI